MRKCVALAFFVGTVVCLSALIGCSNQSIPLQAHSPTQNQALPSGLFSVSNITSSEERLFTNANVFVWVPRNAAYVKDGHTAVVEIAEISAPGAFVKDYRIQFEIQIIETERRLQQFAEWGASDWYFQEHLTASARDGQAGRQVRRDIWNSKKSQRLFINALIKPGGNFSEDFELAKKMVESVRPGPN